MTSHKDLPCLCIRLRRAANAVTAMYDRELRDSGLSLTQYSLLKNLERLSGSSVSELSKEVFLDRSTLARNLSLLSKRGLIVNAAPAHLRNSEWRLTESGAEAIRQSTPAWAGAQKAACAAVGVSDLQAFFSTLRTLQDLDLTEGEPQHEFNK